MKDTEGFRICDFERVKQQNALDGEAAAVHIVTQEQISRGLWVATDLQQLTQVVVLTMNVSAD